MLNTQQEAFIAHFLVHSNATKAAIAAGYSSATAKEQASRLLKHPKIKQRIEEFANQMQKKTAITVEMLVQELGKIAFSDIGLVVDAEGDDVTVKRLADLSSEVRASISEISSIDTKYGTKKAVKLHSKLAAIDQLMRHLGGFVTVNDLIDRLDDEMIDKITAKLLEKAKSNKPLNNNTDEEKA